MEEILILQMGGSPAGTIDKDYPKTKGGRGFQVGEPSVRRVMARLRPARSIITSFHTVCRKDSLDLTEDDRDSDADFNIGVAIGAVQAAAPGVYVTMNGILLPWDRVERDDTGQFVPRRRQLPVTV
ncbi:hypothetical protein GWK47_049502 [Chionoecetes opilio]|uniref:Asparaginase n=1 Tax=Chionoecetes opilio TaxID=41210 RepID=A0A8J4Y9Y8_CHIOP|nr:hypothetical protein GWK47_049502 [Chionoecetes opilio]